MQKSQHGKAGMKCVIITNLHKKEEFSEYQNVIGFITDFNDISINEFLRIA